MRKRKYQFKMFGGLSVTTDGKTIPLSSQIGKQLTALLSYLICNYKQSVSKEKIIENFWPDSENPSNALKFAVHRLRKTLETVEGLPNVEMIVTTANGYQFNPTISVDLDTEAFEKAVLEAKSDDSVEQYRQATDLYDGDFLEGVDVEWVLTDRGYYRSIFVQICNTLADRYLKNNQIDEAIDICEKGLDADELDETLIHTYLISLLKAKKYNFAKSYYDYIKKTYKKKVGVPFESLTQGQSFNQLVARLAIEDDEQTISDTIASAMLPNSTFVDPMIVDNLIFNELCIYAMRNSQRYQTNDYVVTMRLDSLKEKRRNIMNQLMDILKVSFRKTDVVTRNGDSEICLLVRLTNASDVEIIYNRLNTRLSESVGEANYTLTYAIKPLV